MSNQTTELTVVSGVQEEARNAATMLLHNYNKFMEQVTSTVALVSTGPGSDTVEHANLQLDELSWPDHGNSDIVQCKGKTPASLTGQEIGFSFLETSLKAAHGLIASQQMWHDSANHPLRANTLFTLDVQIEFIDRGETNVCFFTPVGVTAFKDICNNRIDNPR